MALKNKNAEILRAEKNNYDEDILPCANGKILVYGHNKSFTTKFLLLQFHVIKSLPVISLSHQWQEVSKHCSIHLSTFTTTSASASAYSISFIVYLSKSGYIIA